MKNLIKNFQELLNFNNSPDEFRKIVFYSESKVYWTHFEPVINSLMNNHKYKFSYVSSSKDDPGLFLDNNNIKTFYIGNGVACTIFFRILKANLLVMTMPDLETFHIKRSIYPVHYIYIFHSMVSSHMIYRHDAFDNYDTIFCVGPHHVHEIREREKKYNLNKKNIFEHGYGRLDEIMSNRHIRKNEINNNHINILIAPSWGNNSIIESGFAKNLISPLLEKDFHVTLRPHPQTKIRNSESISILNNCFSHFSNYHYDDDVTSQSSLFSADIMISDWSGVALEFSFGLDMPVLFIDTPPKMNNTVWESLNITPLEFLIRDEIGEILPTNNLTNVADIIEDICSNQNKYIDRIKQARNKYIFNIGNSGTVAAKELIRLANLDNIN